MGGGAGGIQVLRNAVGVGGGHISRKKVLRNTEMAPCVMFLRKRLKSVGDKNHPWLRPHTCVVGGCSHLTPIECCRVARLIQGFAVLPLSLRQSYSSLVLAVVIASCDRMPYTTAVCLDQMYFFCFCLFCSFSA